MASIPEFLKLTRFEHAVMLAIAVLIGETIALGGIPPLSPIIILSLLVPVFSEMASFSLNDYLDVESDRINKKMTPLVRGAISKNFAFGFGWFALVLSTVFAYFINMPAFVIALVFNILAVAYNYKLKDLPLVGNIYIGLTMAIPFIFGNFVVSPQLNSTLLVLALLGFLSGLAREIIKSVQDMEGDRKARKSKTLPIIIGARNSILIAAFIYVIFIPLTFAPFVLFNLKLSMPAIAVISLADLGIIYIIISIARKDDAKTLKQARNVSLMALFLGLIGYLIAVL
jgi:geranylgeranylglycerol-phosphate geranylgeranyltransferase